MKILRIALGVIIVAYALMGAFSMGGTALYKLNPSDDAPEMARRMIPLFEATPWWLLGLWLVFWLVLLASAWRLFRGQKAFGLYLIAVAGNLVGWWFMSHLPAYRQVFTPAELASDYYIFAGMVVVGLLILVSERGGRGGFGDDMPDSGAGVQYRRQRQESDLSTIDGSSGDGGGFD